MFLQEKKQHSITIFKSNTPWLHCRSSTEGKPLDKEHGSKVKAKKTAQTKTIQNYTSQNWIREATGPTLSSVSPCMAVSVSIGTVGISG